MAIPPSEKKLPDNRITPPNLISSKLVIEAKRDIPQRSLIEGAITLSRTQREVKVHQLQPEQKRIVGILQENLDRMEDKFKQFKKKIDDGVLASDEELKKIKDGIIQASKNLPGLIQDILRIKKNDLPVEDPNLEGPLDFSFEIYKEHWLNAIVNRFNYVNELNLNIEKNRDVLSEAFEIPVNVQIGNNFTDGETHGKGKKPVFIGYKVGDKIKQFVYKPRDARIDIAVISLFKKINSLSENQKSSIFSLPDYKIINLKENHASVWEYIPGPNLGRKGRAPETAGSYVGSMNNDDLKIKLVRLDDVLRLLHVSDIHGENVICKEESGKCYDIIPIDLENVFIKPKKEVATKLAVQDIRSELIKKGLYKPLTSDEVKLIEEVKNEMNKYLVRYIPLGTTVLAGLIADIGNIELLYGTLERTCLADGFEISGHPDAIKKELVIDILNNDIPYFTEKEGILYYGLPERNLVIGRRKI